MKSRTAGVWLITALATSALPVAAEVGNFCVRNFSPGVTCSGSDVQINRVEVVSLSEDCASGDPASAMGTLKVRLACGTISRYDVGLFVALNGNSAESGTQCLHDYLEPPLVTSPVYADSDGNGRQDLSQGPWWNAEPFDQADDCGDIAGNTDAIKTLIPLRFSCVDTNGNGIVDISTCVSWTNGTVSTCPNISGATPGSGTRCSCAVLDIPGVLLPGTAAGRVSGLVLARSGANVNLAWSGSCSATDTDYALYAGTLGNFTTHQSVVCSTGGALSASVALPAGNTYYLVVPRNAQREGSYGLTGAGAERPPALVACVAQQVQSPCP
jgi:hypothetical protein